MKAIQLLFAFLLAKEAYTSQIFPNSQTLAQVVHQSSTIVVARELPARTATVSSAIAPPADKAASNTPAANYVVESVLRAGMPLKPGAHIYIGPANEALYKAMGDLQNKGLPMPSPIVPSYAQGGTRKPADPIILFLADTDLKAKTYSFHCDGATETLDSLEVVKRYIRDAEKIDRH